MIDGVPVRGRAVGVVSKLDCLTVLVDSAVDIEDLARLGESGRGVTVEGGGAGLDVGGGTTSK